MPGGVVIEGKLNGTPTSGRATPLDIRIQKGGLDYFGRLLIQVPEDCRLVADDLFGGQFRWDERQHVAIISWLKLPEPAQFDVQLHLIVDAEASPRSESLEWEFSFIRNNDRESVRPTPLHFQIDGMVEPIDSEPVAPKPSILRAERSWSPIESGWEATVTLENLTPGGFVKLEWPLPPRCDIEVTADAGSTVREENGALTFLWFDYQPGEALRYNVTNCSLSEAQKSPGRLSYIEAGEPKEMAVLDLNSTESTFDALPENQVREAGIQFEVQIAALKTSRVTDYFEQWLDFRHEVKEESVDGWAKYTHGVFANYEEARDHRNDLNRHDRIDGAFVIGRREGKRISTQEALMRTGQQWIP